LPSVEIATDIPCVAPIESAPGFESCPPPPLQPESVHPGAGFATREIGVPHVYPPLQFCGETTVTLPEPAGVASTESGAHVVGIGAKFAVNVASPEIVNLELGLVGSESTPPVPVHSENIHPGVVAVANSMMVVPWV
jgi:hypothetical protein